jgi:hypothetical protein
VVVHAVGKAGTDQGGFQFQALADPDAAVVEEGAAALAGGEHLVAQRVIDHRLGDLPAVGEGNRDRVLGKSVDEIGRAVERVDDPLILAAAALAGGQAGLFC